LPNPRLTRDHQALSLIKAQRSDVTRRRIPDDHWDLVRSDWEARGHDRETYEHTFSLQNVKENQSSIIPVIDEVTGEWKTMVLFRMGGFLNTPERVMRVAGLDHVPDVKTACSEMGLVSFCVIDMEADSRINQWLAHAAVVGSDSSHTLEYFGNETEIERVEWGWFPSAW